MKAINNSHDKVFKAAMADRTVAQSFLENYLPSHIKKATDWKTLRLSPSTFVDKDLQEKYSDLLYSVQMQGKESYLYILIEHQSDPDISMAFRLLEYQVKIWRQHLKQIHKRKKTTLLNLPVIYPIVYYTGDKKPYPYSTDLFDCFIDSKNAKRYLFKPFHLIDLTQIPDNNLKKNSLVTGLMLLQKHIHNRDFELTLSKMLQHGIWVTIFNHDGDYADILLKYSLEIGDVKEPIQFLKQLAEAVPEKAEKIMTGAERLRRDARKETLHQVAENLLKLGQPITLIEEATGLSKTELEKIEKTLH